MAKDLFFEIGVEEVPSRFLPPAMEQIATLLEKALTEARISHGRIRVTATPRRLAAGVEELADRQTDLRIEKAGPAWAAAFDANGAPTKTAIGFASGMGVDPADLVRMETDKGPRAGVIKVETGKPTRDVLPALLQDLFRALAWPKSMRWGSETQAFVRPVQWIVALHGGATLPVRFAGVDAGNRTYGHRFHSPKAIRVRGYDDYLEKLAEAFVLADWERRREAVSKQLADVSRRVKATPIQDDGLLELVTGLVEWPVVIGGRIPDAYMDLPAPVLITPMREHQKYFSFTAEDGQLAPWFAAVGNVDVKDPEVVRGGNERVLNARLSDARFFYDEDIATPLNTLAEKLDGVVYHRKLGTYKDKVLRDQAIARHLAECVAPASRDAALHALWLAKADLLSQMVFEFPELQGTMGRAYARVQGLPTEVSEAIFEHYMPRYSGDDLPKTVVGALCSVADKVDAVVSCLAIGLAPTGAGDPYALRRQAQGAVAVILDQGWSMSLRDLMRAAAEAGASKTGADVGALVENALDFFRNRLAQWLKQNGTPADVVDAVLPVRFDDVTEVVARCKAVAAFSTSADYPTFTIAFKRVANIIGEHNDTRVEPAAFRHDQESRLFGVVQAIQERVKADVAGRRYQEALETIATIRPEVDRFFDAVMVMDKDTEVRRNRLSLMALTASLFEEIADFRRLGDERL